MNNITIAGNLGKDCEIRSLPDGKSVVSFSVADSTGRDKPSIWWNCAFFGERGQKLSPYLLKGQQVTVIGTVTEREWTDRDGMKRKSMDVRVNDITLQGGKREERQSSQPATPTKPAPKAIPQSGFEDMDDEIPF